jgi:DNA-binding response OmpR family regulator
MAQAGSVGEGGGKGPEGELIDMKALIVEDQPAVTHALQQALKDLNLEPLQTSNETQAQEVIQSEAFDIAFVRIDSPAFDGFGIISMIRSTSCYQSSPIVALASQAKDENVLRGFRLNVSCHLTSPFHHAEAKLFTRRILEAFGG